MTAPTFQKYFNNPWIYFLISLVHQCFVILPGEFPITFPDSGSYLSWDAQRTPFYPALLAIFETTTIAAGVQIFVFAIAAAMFFKILKLTLEHLQLPTQSQYFLWGGSLYFATNFELLQFAPAILTESFGISFFIFYFYAVLHWMLKPNRKKFYFVLSFLIFPIALFLLRPSFVLVPAAVTFFFVLKLYFEKKPRTAALVFACLVFYFGIIQGYALWNKDRLGHVGISDIMQHQIIANYMARGMMMEEAIKPEASEDLKTFATAYQQLASELRLSQYSMFEVWHRLNPGKDLFESLKLVNKELLLKRPFGYLRYSLRNLSVLIDGRASFNYLPIENRDLLSRIYFYIQFALDNIFCVFWFIALIYFLYTARRRPLFGVENFIFVTVFAQFLTIAFLGYSELRRQAIGVASIQMLFVLTTWMMILENKRRRKLG